MKRRSCREDCRAAAHRPAGFVSIRDGRRHLLIRNELTGAAPAILDAFATLRHNFSAAQGNRKSGMRLELDGQPPLFVRRSKRGGFLRHFVDDLYLGFQPRVVREIGIAEVAEARGIPVARSMGAIIQTLAPAVYRAALITAALTGRTLWDLLADNPDRAALAPVVAATRAALAQMHQGGLAHADLNLHNLFVTGDADSCRVVILDLDKARLYPGPLPARVRRRHLRRLLRSRAKLDRVCPWFDPRELF
ncbi:MAG TPA: lipopolysaccharide kinase InaA family protein [Candidatus Binataceae bacterium]|jgi:hypothetical protein|nr:lipopolysaccharide kinase InaA family protein [Candidatus Binataceae bacterium]